MTFHGDTNRRRNPLGEIAHTGSEETVKKSWIIQTSHRRIGFRAGILECLMIFHALRSSRITLPGGNLGTFEDYPCPAQI